MGKLFNRGRELFLLIFSAVLLLLMLVSLEMAQGNTPDKSILYIAGGYVGVFAIAHVALCFTAPDSDQVLLPIAATLNAIGLVIIYRLDLARDSSLANRQLMWSLVGIVLMVATLLIVRDHRELSRFSYLLGLLGLVLLALPLVSPQPAEADARIWIKIGPFSVQPGEFSKILLLLFFAQLLAQKRALFTVAGYRILGLTLPRLRDLAPILMVWAIALLIMAATNDFGPALLLFATVLGLVYFATGRTSWLIIGAGLTAVGGYAIYQISDKIQTRVANYLDPFADINGTGYQASQALFGLSWGGVTGTGLGFGYPHLVPVAWSDYVLSSIGEEMGLIGVAAVLILFAVFTTRGFAIAMTVRDVYGKLVASGLALTIAIQVFLVAGGVSGLLPMTGMTTPFVSAGGSAVMANYVLLGLLLRISNNANRPLDHDPAAQENRTALRQERAGVGR